MLKIKTIVFRTLFFCLLFSGSQFALAGNQDSLKLKATQLFDEGKYNQVLPLFRELLDTNPDDTMLNFYYGASRTETGHFAEGDIGALKKAADGLTPAKVYYYLGIQYQAREQWEQALRYYNQFRLKASDREKTGLNLPDKIQQCFNHENPYSDIIGNRKTAKNETTTDSTSAGNEANRRIEVGMPIKFRVNSNIIYLSTTQFITDKGKSSFLKAQALQNELDFNLKKMNELREEYRKVSDENEKNVLGNKIITLENETYALKEEVSQLLIQSANSENEYWQNAGQAEIEKLKAENEKLAASQIKPAAEENNKILPADTTPIIDPNILLESAENAARAGIQKEDDDLVYKIQIGAYSKKLPPYVDRLFKKLSLIRKIDSYTDENGVVVYTTGNLRNLEDAFKMREQVRQEGIEDAFVVPYFNGKRITLEQAKKIEAEL